MNETQEKLYECRHLINENHRLLDLADRVGDEITAAFIRPWRWGKVGDLWRERDRMIARIEANSDRIDLLQDEVERGLP